MSIGASGDQTRTREYEALVNDAKALFTRIPGRFSIEEDARLARRTGAWRGALKLAGLLTLLALLTRVGADLADVSGIAPTATDAATLLGVGFVVVLAAGARGRRLALNDAAARPRQRLLRALDKVRRFELRHSDQLDISQIEQTSREFENRSPPPPEIERQAISLANRMGPRLDAIPSDGSDTADEFVFSGRALIFWRPFFWWAAFGFIATLVVQVVHSAWPTDLGLPGLDTPLWRLVGTVHWTQVAQVWQSIWGWVALFFAAAALLCLIYRVIRKDFSADGVNAVQLAKLTIEVEKFEAKLERYSPTEAERIAAIIRASATSQKQVSQGTKPLRDAGGGLRRAIQAAQRRALVQVVLGAALGIGGLVLLGYVLLDTMDWYEKVAQGQTACAAGGGCDALNAEWRRELFISMTISKTLIALGLNAVAFFFLAGFRRSQADARYFRNELTTVEMRAWALEEAKSLTGVNKILESVVTQLGHADRNPTMPAGAANGHILELRAITDELRVIFELLRIGRAAPQTGPNEGGSAARQ